MVSKAEFLGKLPIFSELYVDELEELAQITDEYEFEAGAPIAYQRDIADRFYIVRSGRLVGRRLDGQGMVQERKFYLPGDYFKDIWLFTPSTHDMTINAAVDGRLYVIEEQKFLPFLIKHPDILDVLDLSEEAAYEAEHTQVALPGREVKRLNLLTDEIVEFYERRTRWLLFFQISIPALIWAVLLFFTVELFLADSLILGFMVGLITLLLTIFLFLIYLDWRNDYFVITNKHLIHHEIELFRFRAREDKVPLDQVQSVEILRPNFLQTLLNVGTARITTAASAGVLLFDFIADPKVVEETINRLRQLVQAIDAGREQAVMRESIEDHFESPPAFQKVEEREGVRAAQTKPEISFLERFRRNFYYRVVDGNTITYRRHYIPLVLGTWKIIALGNFLLILGLWLLRVNYLLTFGVFILGLINLAVFIWRFEDWRNETFQVTDRYVIDIDRQPFGFGESRKQAELGNVQNVNADRPGILHTVFNYGNVHIETAGASADITFELVYNPSRVQSDVFQRRETFVRNQRIRDGQRRRKEYAVFIDAFQQASEQNRLPERRTPTLDDLDEYDEPDLPDDDIQI